MSRPAAAGTRVSSEEVEEALDVVDVRLEDGRARGLVCFGKCLAPADVVGGERPFVVRVGVAVAAISTGFDTYTIVSGGQAVLVARAGSAASSSKRAGFEPSGFGNGPVRRVLGHAEAEVVRLQLPVRW